MTRLRDAFLPHLPAAQAMKAVADKELERALGTLVDRAREGDAGFSIDAATFLAHSAARLRTEQGVLASLDQTEAADLWLACACAAGCKAAQTAFVERYTPIIRGALASFVRQGIDIEEIEQRVVSYLIFPRDERPAAVAGYSGSGSLAAYVRVSVVREAVRSTKQIQRMTPRDDAAELAPELTNDAELEALKRRYRDQFKAAFVQAVEALDPDEVLLLRYHYYSGLGVRQIASLRGDSKSTVARQLTAVRDKVRQETQRRLMAHAKVRRSEAASIMRLVRSQMDVGLSQFLK